MHASSAPAAPHTEAPAPTTDHLRPHLRRPPTGYGPFPRASIAACHLTLPFIPADTTFAYASARLIPHRLRATDEVCVHPRVHLSTILSSHHRPHRSALRCRVRHARRQPRSGAERHATSQLSKLTGVAGMAFTDCCNRTPKSATNRFDIRTPTHDIQRHPSMQYRRRECARMNASRRR